MFLRRVSMKFVVVIDGGVSGGDEDDVT